MAFHNSFLEDNDKKTGLLVGLFCSHDLFYSILEFDKLCHMKKSKMKQKIMSLHMTLTFHFTSLHSCNLKIATKNHLHALPPLAVMQMFLQ